jgi:soluble lytic murein transglycosylase-like protein
MPAAWAGLALAALICLLLIGAEGARGATVTVAPGETLSAIAARHGTSVGALAQANGIADPDRVQAGRRLVLPGAGASSSSVAASPGGARHRVRAGETLGAIAARYGTSVSGLAALNGIRNPNAIVAGTSLVIPGALPAPAGAAPAAASGDVRGLLHASAARHGLDPALARAVAWQESRWNQRALSSAGAIGVMQLMPGTARWFGPAVLGRRIDPHRVEDNIDAGVAYLAWLIRQSGSTRTAVAAYYQGLSSLRQRGPYDDTRDYVASVMSFRGRV